jgi:hypothetical protein
LSEQPVYLFLLHLGDFDAGLDVAHVAELLADVVQLRLELRVLLEETVDLIVALLEDLLLRLGLFLQPRDLGLGLRQPLVDAIALLVQIGQLLLQILDLLPRLREVLVRLALFLLQCRDLGVEVALGLSECFNHTVVLLYLLFKVFKGLLE